MPVGHIEGVNLRREYLRYAGDLSLVAYHPELVAEAVLIGKTVDRRDGYGFSDYLRQPRIVLVGEEHRLDVGVLDTHVHHPVVLLVLARELVLLYGSRTVVVGMGAEHDSVLGPAVHGLRIDIVAGTGVAHQPAPLLPLAEVLHGLVVDPGVVVLEHGLEIYLGLGYVQQGFLPSHRPGLGRVEHIVGRGGDFGHQLPGRTQGGERFHSYHNTTCSGGISRLRRGNMPLSAWRRQVRR